MGRHSALYSIKYEVMLNTSCAGWQQAKVFLSLWGVRYHMTLDVAHIKGASFKSSAFMCRASCKALSFADACQQQKQSVHRSCRLCSCWPFSPFYCDKTSNLLYRAMQRCSWEHARMHPMSHFCRNSERQLTHSVSGVACISKRQLQPRRTSRDADCQNVWR